MNSSAIPGRNEFGRNVNGSNGYVTGDLDEMRIYGRALRPEDATTLSANPPTCPPEILQPPIGFTVNPGASVIFAVTAIGGQPLVYQWVKDGKALPEGNGATLPRNNVQPPDAGYYSVIVSNSFGAVTSAPVALTIVFPPPAGLTSISLGIPNYISSASFLNSGYGFVSYRGFGGGPGGVSSTRDGGQTWIASNIGVTNSVNSIQLIDSVAYLAGSGGFSESPPTRAPAGRGL